MSGWTGCAQLSPDTGTAVRSSRDSGARGKGKTRTIWAEKTVSNILNCSSYKHVLHQWKLYWCMHQEVAILHVRRTARELVVYYFHIPDSIILRSNYQNIQGNVPGCQLVTNFWVRRDDNLKLAPRALDHGVPSFSKDVDSPNLGFPYFNFLRGYQ